MAFWESGEEKKEEEMEEVKREVEGRKTKLPEPPEPPIPEESPERASESIEEPSLEAPAPTPETEGEGKAVKTPTPEERAPSAAGGPERPPKGGGEFAPLFVKIDKYRQVLQNMEEVKNTLEDLRDLFTLMSEIDEVKRSGMKELREGISGLADTLLSMDEKFIRPKGTEKMIEEPTSETGKTVQKLRGELKDVKKELDRLE